MIRVMIAEDNTSLNHLCCNYLTNDKDIQIVFSAYDGEETLEKYKELRPDVLLLDLDLPKKKVTMTKVTINIFKFLIIIFICLLYY